MTYTNSCNSFDILLCNIAYVGKRVTMLSSFFRMLVSAELKGGFWWKGEIGYLLLKIVTNPYKIVVINIVVSTGLQKPNVGFRPTKNIRIVSERLGLSPGNVDSETIFTNRLRLNKFLNWQSKQIKIHLKVKL